MQYYKFKEYMSSKGYNEYREGDNLSCYDYYKGNKLIRTFKLTNGEMVYLESKLKHGSLTDIKDIDKISLEFEELKVFAKQLKETLAK